MTQAIRILIQPGLNNSGPQHWQSLWQQQHPEFERVEQENWDQPLLSDWLATLQHYLAQSDAPTVIVAHSLGSIATAHLAARRLAGNLVGVLLVAPADVERVDAPEEVRNFAPLPLGRLPIPGIIVASDNDPYCSWARSEQLAQAWGSELVRLNAAGHINADSGFGAWPEGQVILQGLLQRLTALQADTIQGFSRMLTGARASADNHADTRASPAARPAPAHIAAARAGRVSLPENSAATTPAPPDTPASAAVPSCA